MVFFLSWEAENTDYFLLIKKKKKITHMTYQHSKSWTWEKSFQWHQVNVFTNQLWLMNYIQGGKRGRRNQKLWFLWWIINSVTPNPSIFRSLQLLISQTITLFIHSFIHFVGFTTCSSDRLQWFLCSIDLWSYLQIPSGDRTSWTPASGGANDKNRPKCGDAFTDTLLPWTWAKQSAQSALEEN